MGLDDKLKIRGLNSEYFTIYLACLVGFLLFAGLSVLSALTGVSQLVLRYYLKSLLSW